MKTKKNEKSALSRIYSLLAIAILGIGFQLGAEDKPSEIDVEANRVYFRGGLGSGVLNSAETSEDKQVPLHLSILDRARGVSTPVVMPVSTQNPAVTPVSLEFEYRYKNQFRVNLNTLNISGNFRNSIGMLPDTTTTNGQYSITYGYEEKRTSLGAGYYLPVASFLNIGGLIKSYNIEQNSSINDTTSVSAKLYGTSVSGTGFSFGTLGNKYSGLSPVVGIEFLPFQWLEVGYTLEALNLKGRYNNYSFGRFTFFQGNVASTTTTSFGNSDVTFRGNIHDLYVKIKPAKWFGLKLGYVNQLFYKTYGFRIDMSDPTASGILALNAAYSMSTLQYSIKYPYIQFEFSRSFN